MTNPKTCNCKESCYIEDLSSRINTFYTGDFTPLLDEIKFNEKINFVFEENKKFKLKHQYKPVQFIKKIDKENAFRYLFKMDDNIIYIDVNIESTRCSLLIDDISLISLLWKENELRYAIASKLNKEEKYLEASRWLIEGDLILLDENEAATIPTLSERTNNTISISNDDEVSISLHKKKAVNGDIKAMLYLGAAYDPSNKLMGADMPEDYNENEAIKWYKMAAKLENEVGMNNLALIYEEKEQYKESFYWFNKLSLLKRADYILIIASYYKEGKGVNKNKSLANKYYNEAFELAKSNMNLAEDIAFGYSYGQYGLEKNKKNALEWYEKAVELGSITALSNIERLK